MNTTEEIYKLQQKIVDNQILLSDAILAAMKLARRKVPDHINIWLNQELMGLDPATFSLFTHLKADYRKVRFIGNGIWCYQPTTGVFVDNPQECQFVGLFVSLGAQSIEAELSQFLDVESLCSDGGVLPRNQRNSIVMLQVVDAPGYFFRCHLRELVRIYLELRKVLIEVLDSLTPYFSESALLYR